MRQVPAVAEMAVGEQALVDRVHRELRRPPFAHRRFLGVRHALVAQPERAVAEQPAALHLGVVFGERKSDALELGDRAPEGFPLQRVGPGLVERGTGGTQALQADHGARIVEALHGLGEAGALPADAVAVRYAHAVEPDRAAPDRKRAQVVIGRAGDAGRIEVDQEGGHPARAGAVRVGARHGEHAVGMGGHGDRGLLAVDHPVVAVAPGA